MKKILLLSLFSLLIFTQSCHSDEDPPQDDPIAIGDFYEGGVIFYLDETGEHDLVVTAFEQSYGTTWKCDTTIIIQGAEGIAIGTGTQNTADILSVCNTSPTIAAAICNSLVLNGYDDWFLPSKDELNEIYLNKDLIDDTAVNNGGILLQHTNYWSSSHSNSNTVWVQTFADGGSQYGNGEYESNHVRAVRSF